MWISDGYQLVGGQGPREDDLVSYEKYQLVILGVLQTRVTYWYTYRLPNTYLPIWLGDLFVYFLLCPTKLQFLNRIRISWPINCAVQVPKNQKPHFANVYFLLYFYSYRNHPLSIFFGNSSFWPQHCIASFQKVCFSLFPLLCALFSLANLKPWAQKKRFLFTDFPFSSPCCCRRSWLKSLIQNIIKIFWSPQIDTLQSVPSLVPSNVKRQPPFSCENMFVNGLKPLCQCAAIQIWIPILLLAWISHVSITHSKTAI